MKPLVFSPIKLLLVTLLLFSGNSIFGQKSTEYNSIEKQVEEITQFIDETATETISEISDFLTDSPKNIGISENKTKIEATVNEIKDATAPIVNDMIQAASEVKVWLSKQYFAPLRHKKTVQPDNKFAANRTE